MRFLVDTNVISEIQKPRADARVLAWFAAAEEQDLHLSVVTIGEIAQGIEQVRPSNAAKAAALEAWLTELRVRFADRVALVDMDIAERWGRLNAAALQAGVKPAYSDNLLAATAIVRGMVLVTRNIRDFERSHVMVKNPWEG